MSLKWFQNQKASICVIVAQIRHTMDLNGFQKTRFMMLTTPWLRRQLQQR